MVQCPRQHGIQLSRVCSSTNVYVVHYTWHLLVDLQTSPVPCYSDGTSLLIYKSIYFQLLNCQCSILTLQVSGHRLSQQCPGIFLWRTTYLRQYAYYIGTWMKAFFRRSLNMWSLYWFRGVPLYHWYHYIISIWPYGAYTL